MRKIILIGLFLLTIFGISSCGPYNLFKDFNEENELKKFVSNDHKFKGQEIIKIDYKGSDTYYIQTKEDEKTRHYIVMRYQSSVMNGHWKVFEQTTIGNYY
ncbi:hypothetical protein [Guptibacillus hwajinpoensis]|uniref:hypothetical protein n=1 Tax=Guptibacillus hwajinpoensis TaxID=208199 RepID=UPI0024B33E95|nr:hypothetical protein [Pseudalkalibacillus hwajinpoensis]